MRVARTMVLVAVAALVPAHPAAAEHSFDDVSHDALFHAEIEALAAAGVTKGCNPPVNDLFCPDDVVTRGQMAAFLVRALGYVDDGGGDRFVDDDGSVFEGDIDRLATAGVTKGCNPPTNDRYCPDDLVTREQMAAFLGRALGLPPSPLLTTRADGVWSNVNTVVVSDGFIEEVGDQTLRRWTIEYFCESGLCDAELDSVDPATGQMLGTDVPLEVVDQGVHHLPGEAFFSDCVDEDGTVLVADGYDNQSSQSFWVTKTTDGEATMIEGTFDVAGVATADAIAAGCPSPTRLVIEMVGTRPA